MARLKTKEAKHLAFNPQILNNWSDDDLNKLLENLEDLEALRVADLIGSFIPYPKQLEFINAGSTKRERLFMAGNRVGKTKVGSLEVAAHLTGNYPPYWEGRRFLYPTVGWVAGASGASVRDVLQPILFGYVGETRPTGFISKDLIVSQTPSHGVGGQFDIVKVKHVSGGVSTLILKSYEQRVEKWMGSEIHFCLCDEEPPMLHYDEALARLRPDGVMLTTFTPLGGLTELLIRFLRETDKNAAQHRTVVQMSLHEAKHFTESEIEQRISGYSEHLREARTFGIPALGSGAVFTTPLSQVQVDSEMEIPPHWSKLWSIDFGLWHPFAAVLIAYDREHDTIYVLHTIRMEGARPAEHVAAMQRIAATPPVAYPHDGATREKSSGETLITTYRNHGLNCLPHHSTFLDGTYSTEAGILEMQERFSDGRLRIKSHCSDLFDEYRGYHRDERGELVKRRDDILSALRGAVMMKRAARPGPLQGPGVSRKINYNTRHIV